MKNLYTKTAVFLALSLLISSNCKKPYNDIKIEDIPASAGEIKNFSDNNYGYLIYDPDNRTTIKAWNLRKEFIPASVTKLYTALFAAEILGLDYTFTTSLSYTGKISDNRIIGSLYLTGSGDPEFSLNELLAIINELKLKKIYEIEGSFYYDETAFASRKELDSKMSLDASYNTGISPLSFNSNIIYALKRKDDKKKITSVDLVPHLPSFDSYLYNKSYEYPYIRYSSENEKEIWGFPDKNLWEDRQRLPVKNPALFTAQLFRMLCEIHGIKIPAPKQGQKPSSAKTVFETKSSNLIGIIKNMLFSSNNLTAEILHAVSSQLYDSINKKSENRTGAMEDFYKKNFRSIKWDNFKLINASGLTAQNRTTPEQTAAVLLYMENLKCEGFNTEEILPVSGWDGTMRMRLDMPDAAFRVYAKTGNISYASGLAGLFYAKSGKRYIFTIFISDIQARSEYDAKKNKTAEDITKSNDWSKKAASAIDGFVLQMIKEL